MYRTVLLAGMAVLIGANVVMSPARVQAASPGDVAFIAKLRPIFLELVTAAQKVVSAGTDISAQKYSKALPLFNRSLAIYKDTQTKDNALKPTSNTAHIQSLIKKSIASYVAGLKLYISGTRHHSPSEIGRGIPIYNKGNTYLTTASTAISRLQH
jgi:hypothetical protein